VALAWAFVVGIIVGGVVGGLNAFLVVGMKINPVIATLGTMYIGRGLANVVAGGSPVTGVPLESTTSRRASLVRYPRGGYLRGYRGCHAGHGTEDGTRSVDDRQWWQSRSGESVGDSRKSHQVILYIVSGLAAGIAGILINSRVATATLHPAPGSSSTSLSRLFLGGTAITGGQRNNPRIDYWGTHRRRAQQRPQPAGCLLESRTVS